MAKESTTKKKLEKVIKATSDVKEPGKDTASHIATEKEVTPAPKKVTSLAPNRPSLRNAKKSLEVDDEPGNILGDELERGKHRRAKGKKPVKEDAVHDVNRLMRLVSSGTENLTTDELNRLEDQKKKLRYLLGKGKERGYVTNTEINDNLPDHITDPEIIDQIVMMIETIGIKVFEYEPSREELLLSGTSSATVDDDDYAVEEAEKILASTTSANEFGRTTDPVRMYMREIGTYDLLDKTDEAEIARKLEGSIKSMISAIADCPKIINEISRTYDEVLAGRFKIENFIDEFIDDDPQVEDEVLDVEDDAIKMTGLSEDDEDEQLSREALEKLRQKTADFFKEFNKLVEKQNTTIEKSPNVVIN